MRSWAPYLVGIAAGFLAGFFGVGGGILIVPSLVLLLGIEQRLAHGVSLGATLPLALAGVVGFVIDGSVDWPVAAFMALGAVGGAVLGTDAMRRLSVRALRILFAAFMVLAAARLVVGIGEAPGRASIDLGLALAFVVVGLFSGGVAGLLGVGGGIVMVPVQVLIFGMLQPLAKGTSLAVIVPTALAGTLRNIRRDTADVALSAKIGVGGILSSFVGARLALSVDQDLAAVLFGGLMVVAAWRMLRR